jgi:hypothetical protein
MIKYTGKAKVGDVVKRVIRSGIDRELLEKYGKYGLVIHRQMIGNPIHPCVTVSWPKQSQPRSILTVLF